ncbi:hypothetical protein WN51_12519 [Melipona quadrifasciata]|uniref:Uncharacterized protein n=1 Tax=Melipona quadrifasciata TaxID=166423 RepID=A0A0N1ITQ4_9HYME|nr:hypothetical protein WN51_12519 [Melipona quadrifasciata]
MNSRRELPLPDINDAHHANDSDIIKLIITPEARDHNDACGFPAANYGKQQQDDCITSDNEILSSSHSIEILQTQYLLKISYVTYVTTERNDSGIHTVTSSKSTSPHDESTQEQGTSVTENQQQAHCLDGEDSMENLNSSKMKSSTTSGSSCVCNLTNAKTVASLDHSISVHDPHAKKYIPRISSSFDGANEEFFGAVYVNGQIFVYDSNRSSFQINCTQNWENLSSSIDASTSRKEFWSQPKCENSPSTPQTIEKIWTKSEQYTHDDIATPEKTKNSDDHHDCSDLGSDINVNAINDKTDAYLIEDQQRDEDSNVLDQHDCSDLDSDINPLINNDAQETSQNVAEKEEEVDIKDETTNAGVEITHGTHDTVMSIDATTFFRVFTPGNRRISTTVTIT